jgi:hypothetical protein
MKACYKTKFIDVQKNLVGVGDTKDLAFNELLEKCKLFELDTGCGDACRPLLNPPDNVKFRVYCQKDGGKIRWKCFWGPGLLEFECAPIGELED